MCNTYIKRIMFAFKIQTNFIIRVVFVFEQFMSCRIPCLTRNVMQTRIAKSTFQAHGERKNKHFNLGGDVFEEVKTRKSYVTAICLTQLNRPIHLVVYKTHLESGKHGVKLLRNSTKTIHSI